MPARLLAPSRVRPLDAARRALDRALLVLGGVGAAGTRPLSAQPPRYAVAAWSIEHGLPSSVVTGVAQAADGYLWLTSYDGLVRFDGTSFRTFAHGDVPGLERGSFVALAAERRAGGAVWAGSESGELVRRQGGRWRVFTAADGLPGTPITALAADGHGGVWVGTRTGVWHLAGERAVRVALPAGTAAPAVAALAAGPGALWIGTVADGVVRLALDPRHPARARQAARVTTREGLASDRVDALLAEGDTLWVGAYGAPGISRVVAGPALGARVTHLATADAAGDSTGAPRRVRWFHRDRTGALWLAAENGVFALDASDPRRATLVPLADPGAASAAADAAGRVKAEAIGEDTDGNLWVGTRQSGLFRLRRANFATLAAADGLPHPFAFAVTGDGRGGAWVGTQAGAASRAVTLATSSAQHSPSASAAVAAGTTVRDALLTPGGDVWLATNNGLVRLLAGRATGAATFTRRDGLPDDRTRTLAAGRAGRVWVGTYNGVGEWRPDSSGRTRGTLRAYGPADGLPDGYTLSVHEDAAGTLWVGTQTAGLFWRPAAGPGAGRFRPGPPALARQPIFRITEDPDGTLWVGTARGLARVRPHGPDGSRAQVALVSVQHGLPGRTVFQALDDGRGALWLTGPWGVGRAERAALHAVADGRAAAVDVTPFGRGDGMAAREASSIGRAWRAPDGTLWFPTPAGVAVVDPARLPARPLPPPALVEQVLADGAPAELDGTRVDAGVVLAPGTRMLEVRFAAPSFTAPERVRVRYQLDGWDRAWIDGGARRAAFYTNLPPGAYRFRAQASAGGGGWGPVAEVRLALAPHPWQRPSVWALAAAGLTAAGAAAYRWRVRLAARAAAKRAAHQAREEALRAASLRDELTGLYNRRGLLVLAEAQARAAERSGRGFALLFADLDGLKPINDTLGHAAGDQALTDAAAVLQTAFRTADVIARLGGDEFAVLLVDSDALVGDGEAGLAAARERLAERLERHNAGSARPYRLAMSVGASRFDPLAPRPIEVLLDDADRQMYAAKRAKRATREVAAIAG